MSSSMENRPEPLHLYAQDMGGSLVRVMHGDTVVAQDTSENYVKATIAALKMLGHDHDAQVLIQSVSGNPAYNGALKHHTA
jgi:hypothetical protein